MSQKLWQLVLTDSKKSFQARKDDSGKLLNNITNNGLKKDGIAIRLRDGEYTDFSIKVLEDVKPLLTELRVSKAIKMLDENLIQGCIRVLNIDNEVNKYGINLIYSILKIWLEKNELTVPQEYINNAIKIHSEEINKWIVTTRSDPLQCKMQVVNIGQSKKGQSVVPDDWLGREFNNADELHREMDKLDWRKNKPAVTFCCTHSMMIKELYSWKPNDDDSVINYGPKYAIQILPKCSIINFKDNNAYIEWLNELPNGISLLPCCDKDNEKYIIACKLDEVKKENKYADADNVGVLVSRLQKAIRRGRKCSKLLHDTIISLSQAKPYNLPEQQYVKVSGTRQLCWRLFITIIEDVEPYLDDERYMGLLDLLCLALLGQNDPDIQLNDIMIQKIMMTALLVQFNDEVGHNWDWRKGNDDMKVIDNEYIKMAIKCMPMMSGDLKLLKKGGDYIKTIKLNKLPNKTIDELLLNNDEEYANQCKYASNDMHCNPNILLHLQSSLPFIPCDEKKHSTYGLSAFIWENSSKFNVRNKNKNLPTNEDKIILESLKIIQENKDIIIKPEFLNELSIIKEIKLNDKQNISNLQSRIGFLLLFGQKVRIPHEGKNKAIDVIVAGDVNKPCRVKRVDKYLDDKERFDGELRYVDYLNKSNILIKLPKPPEGCSWNRNIKNKVKLSVKIIKSNKDTMVNNLEFYVDNIKLSPFDSRIILNKNSKVIENETSDIIKKLIKQSLYYENCEKLYNEYELNKVLRELWKIRHDNKNYELYKWVEFNGINAKIWKCVLSKLYNNHDDEVMIGPVDRCGNKLHESINYLYEGTLLRIFNMLSFLYPNTITPKTQLKFIINKNVAQYNNLIDDIENLALDRKQMVKTTNTIIMPEIKTKLWDHQEKSVIEMFNGMVLMGKKGHGDASDVGAGKTLSSLSIISKLFTYNFKNSILQHTGFLVLLPTTQLYQTWKDEIIKHTVGFDIIEQHADGTLTKKVINNNSIVITTLGRMRDHPISNSWTLVVIDECLSVQNKEAFQTEEAFKQILCSQYGVIMMSATFFRTRFDKLFYMIKMLKSGLPEEKEYLDTILSECIICNIPEKNRKWITTINKYKLSNELQNKYDELSKQDISSEILYSKLCKLLNCNFDYIKCFEDVIKKIELEGRRGLIYAKSKAEADAIAKRIKTVTRYPDKSGINTVLSYAEGTYGLNDLVIYDTIVSRPPCPDALPQMIGRLNREGQEKNTLFIEYILVENTIEEAGILRLELCNNFYKNYIMPLAEFYDLALGRKKVNDHNKNNKLLKIAKLNNITIIDDTINDKENYINVIMKLMQNQKNDNLIQYNENIIEINKMKSEFTKFV